MIVRYAAAPIKKANWTGDPFPRPFIAGGFQFTLGSFLEEIPADPDIYFSGEETALLVNFLLYSSKNSFALGHVDGIFSL
jgi:hypothetical protein